MKPKGEFYATENNVDGGMDIWYGDGDHCASVYDNLGLDIYAAEITPIIVSALNTAAKPKTDGKGE